MRIDIKQTGMDRARLFLRSMAHNARTLYPLASKARQRWNESETRTFADRAGWTPRTAKTEARYARGPIKTLNGRRSGARKAQGTGFFTGGLNRALTKPHQKGITDRAEIKRGRLVLTVGIKGGRQPRAYGNWFADGGRVVVTFDEIAQRDLALDTRTHVIPEGTR